MAVTSPAVSSQDATPVTPKTTTGATLLSKEKPLNAAHKSPIPGPAPPTAPPTAPTAVPGIRPPNPQTGAVPLGPEPTASKLSHAPGEGGPPANRAEAVKRSPEEPKLTGQGIAGPLDIARNFVLEEEGVPASQAERETFRYWRSGRSQAKRAIEGLETAAGSLKKAEDVIGEKALVEPEKITHWRQGRVVDPAKYAPAALAALPDLLTSQAKVAADQLKNTAKVLEEDIDGGKALIEPEKITYWKPGRVTDPAHYAPAALAALPAAVESQVKGVGEHLGNAFEFLKDEVDGGKALIEPDKITYWSHGRVADPAKYAPAALAALPNAPKDLGLGMAGPQVKPDTVPPSPPAGPVPHVTPREPTREYSHSEYSDYRSSTISYHSSRATMSSGQKRPRQEVRDAFSSPYL